MAKHLFDDRYAPITSEFGFLECDAGTARDAYIDWMRPIQAERGVGLEVSEVSGDMVSRLTSLLPLTSVERRRVLFLPTKQKWTAYLDNGWQGSDAFATVSFLCQRVGCRGLRAVSIPHTFKETAGGSRGSYGATIFEFYGATTDGCSFLNIRRSVFAANDGGRWTFTAEGQPLEFEDLRQYEAHRIQDRFTADMLDRYLTALGIRFFSTEFYEPTEPAQLVFKVGPSAAGLKTYSLADAQSNY